jgi:hypothetical protein
VVASIGNTQKRYWTSQPHATLPCVQLSAIHARHELGLAYGSTRATSCTLAMVTLELEYMASLVWTMPTRVPQTGPCTETMTGSQ